MSALNRQRMLLTVAVFCFLSAGSAIQAEARLQEWGLKGDPGPGSHTRSTYLDSLFKDVEGMRKETPRRARHSQMRRRLTQTNCGDPTMFSSCYDSSGGLYCCPQIGTAYECAADGLCAAVSDTSKTIPGWTLTKALSKEMLINVPEVTSSDACNTAGGDQICGLPCGAAYCCPSTAPYCADVKNECTGGMHQCAGHNPAY